MIFEIIKELPLLVAILTITVSWFDYYETIMKYKTH